jgi:uncharacterized protein (DUF302 family)
MTEALIITTVRSDVATTVDRLTSALQRRGITLFATIDHAGGARDAGLDLADEVVMIFGNPAAGTPLMQQDPRIGIELPLRLLIWSDAGTTRVGYHDPVRLGDRYDLGPAADRLHRLRDLLAALVAELAQPPS